MCALNVAEVFPSRSEASVVPLPPFTTNNVSVQYSVTLLVMNQPAYGYKCYMLPDSFQIGFTVTPMKSLKVKQLVGGIILMIL